MLTLQFCSLCEERLKEMGNISYTLMEEIICLYIESESAFALPDKFYPCLVNYLERKNYIVTTECSGNDILMKPLGCVYKDTKSGKFCDVCFDRENHK